MQKQPLIRKITGHGEPVIVTLGEPVLLRSRLNHTLGRPIQSGAPLHVCCGCPFVFWGSIGGRYSASAMVILARAPRMARSTHISRDVCFFTPPHTPKCVGGGEAAPLPL